MSKPKAGVGAVAKQEKGSEVQGAAGQAQGDLGTKEQENKQGEQQAKQEKQAEIDREVAQNTEKQTSERGRVARETQQQREEWRTEQDKKVEDADKQSEDEHGAKNKEIVKARDDKDKEVGERKDKDNAQIDTERENAEKEAEKKKEEEKPSGGLFGWIADKVADFFKGLLAAVTAVFDAARKAVNGIIDTFKEWANKAIDFVRDLAISAINALADALIAIGDVLLAAFPELRDKFRNAIEGLRDAAVAKVNELADGLKKAVNALLDVLAAGLNKLLDVLEAGIKAVIKAYQAVIEGVIKFAQAAIEALGKFAALVADIAPDPGGWIGKAGSSAKTGITDHLWGAIKVGVKRWFDTKVEGILGLGKAVINVLVKGCVSLKQIGKMAWDAIIASLPMMIASLVIEKVVSMIVPAAGAILTIVQGLMAAWQSISSILAAFGKFWAYLKAVKAGPAACLFAEAVAAGVVALLDFIANFLMIRLSSATKGVGKRLKAMSQKIMDGLKKTGKGARSAAGNAVNNARGAMRNARQKVAEPSVAPKPKGAPSPGPKAPVKPKDTATPKGPAKQESAGAKPKDGAEGPGKDRTPEREPSKDRTPDKDQAPSKDKTPEPAAKKKKEIEGPKPAKPKKPKSPAGKALAKAKGAVKSALKKVGNAAKTLGKKLKKTKVGKALKNSASKLRNVFKKKKDRLRDDKRRQQEQKRRDQDQRKKDEKSKESKEARLRRIVARMKPRLDSLMNRGVRDGAFRAALGAMKLWYRLSGLARRGDRTFEVEASLNPRLPALEKGRELVPEDIEQRVLAYIQQALGKAREQGGGSLLNTYSAMRDDKPFKNMQRGAATEYNTGTPDQLRLTRKKGPNSDLSGEINVQPHPEELAAATGIGSYKQMARAVQQEDMGSGLGTQGLQALKNEDDINKFPGKRRQLPAQVAVVRSMAEGLRVPLMLAVGPAELRLIEKGMRSPDDVLTKGPLVSRGANSLTAPIRNYMRTTGARLKDLAKIAKKQAAAPEAKTYDTSGIHARIEEARQRANTGNTNFYKRKFWWDDLKPEEVGTEEVTGGKRGGNGETETRTRKVYDPPLSSVTKEQIEAKRQEIGTPESEIKKMRDTIVDLLIAEGVLTTEKNKEHAIEDILKGVDELLGEREWLFGVYGLNKGKK